MARVGSEAGRYGGFQNHGHSGIADIIQPLSITTAAISDAYGSITFTFPSIPVSQDWIFSCNVADAPSTAVFLAESVPTNLGSWTAGNNAGPFKAGANETLVVKGFALLPNLTYQCTITGEAVTSGKSSNVFPYPSTSTVVTQNQAGLSSLTITALPAANIGTFFEGQGSTATSVNRYNTTTNTNTTFTGFTGGLTPIGVYLSADGTGWWVYSAATNSMVAQNFNISTGALIGSAITNTLSGSYTYSQTKAFKGSPDNNWVPITFLTNFSGSLFCSGAFFNMATKTWTNFYLINGQITNQFSSFSWSGNSQYGIGICNSNSGGGPLWSSFLMPFLFTSTTVTQVYNTGSSTLLAPTLYVVLNQTGSAGIVYSSGSSYDGSGISGTFATPITLNNPYGYTVGASVSTPYITPFLNPVTGVLWHGDGTNLYTVNQSTYATTLYYTGSVPTDAQNGTAVNFDSTGNFMYYLNSSLSRIFDITNKIVTSGTVTSPVTTTINWFVTTVQSQALATPPTGYAYRILTVTAYNSTTSTGYIALSTNSSFSTGIFDVTNLNATTLLNGRMINKTVYAVTSATSGTTLIEIGYDLVFYDLTSV